jgi:hypothetical protein
MKIANPAIARWAHRLLVRSVEMNGATLRAKSAGWLTLGTLR